jgi:hypothetical protein
MIEWSPGSVRLPSGPRVLLLVIACLLASISACKESESPTIPPPGGPSLGVMAEVERYTEDGNPLVDVTVVVSLDSVAVAGARVRLNGVEIPAATGSASYRALGLPYAGGDTVRVEVTATQGRGTQRGAFPGAVVLTEPAVGLGIPDSSPIQVSWTPIEWGSAPLPRAITIDYTQGAPFYYAVLAPEAVEHRIPSPITRPSSMEFILVEAWAGHADPGNLERGDWVGEDGLRVGSRAVTWVEITE